LLKTKLFTDLNKLINFINIELKKEKISITFLCTETLLIYIDKLKESGVILNYHKKNLKYYNLNILHITLFKFNKFKFLDHTINYSPTKKIIVYQYPIYFTFKRLISLVSKNTNKNYIFSTIKGEIKNGKELIQKKTGGLLKLIIIF
jgi:hypothetical protein